EGHSNGISATASSRVVAGFMAFRRRSATSWCRCSRLRATVLANPAANDHAVSVLVTGFFSSVIGTVRGMQQLLLRRRSITLSYWFSSQFLDDFDERVQQQA